jgi:hypothetical protein
MLCACSNGFLNTRRTIDWDDPAIVKPVHAAHRPLPITLLPTRRSQIAPRQVEPYASYSLSHATSDQSAPSDRWDMPMVAAYGGSPISSSSSTLALNKGTSWHTTAVYSVPQISLPYHTTAQHRTLRSGDG